MKLDLGLDLGKCSSAGSNFLVQPQSVWFVLAASKLLVELFLVAVRRIVASICLTVRQRKRATCCSSWAKFQETRPGLSTMTPITLLIYIHLLLLICYIINAPLAYFLVCYLSSMRLAICLSRASPKPDEPNEVHDLMCRVSDVGFGTAVFLSYFVVAILLKSFNIPDLAPGISADTCKLMVMVCESMMLFTVHLAMAVQCASRTTAAAVSFLYLRPSTSPEEWSRAWSMVSTWERLLMLPHYLVAYSHMFLVFFYFVNLPFAYLLVRFLFVTWTAISTFSREELGTRCLAMSLNGPDELHNLECLLYILKLVVWIYFSNQVLHIIFCGFNEHSGMLEVKVLESAVLITDLLGRLVRRLVRG